MHPALTHQTADRPRSRTAAAVTGFAVLGVCVTYAGWSLLVGRSDETESTAPGVELGVASDGGPALVPPPEAAPVARLTLDDGTSLGPIPVTNAHLEVSDERGSPADIAPAVQQLRFEPGATARDPQAGAWLTGTIEPAVPFDASGR